MEKNNEELFCFGLLVSDCVEKFFSLAQRRMQIRADCTKRAIHSKVLTQERCIIDEYKPCTKQLRTCSDRGCTCIERNIGEGFLLPNLLSCRCASDTFECPHVLALGCACVQRLMKFYVDFRVCP